MLISLSKTAENILAIICRHGGKARFSLIHRELGDLPSSLVAQHLKTLMRRGLVEKLDKGLYGIVRMTPYCVGMAESPLAYVGGLGLRMGRELPEPAVAIDLLGREFSRKVVFATPEAIKDWGAKALETFEIRIIDESSLIDFNGMLSALRRTIDELAGDYVVIGDCTSLNKVFTIAMYKLASELMFPLIYVYEGNRRLVWLISEESVRRRVFTQASLR